MKDKSDLLDHFKLVKWVKWILVFASILIISVWAIYALNFSTQHLSSSTANWGAFGDFVGGTANPVLTFLTLVILALTIIVQSRQLEISSKELELSRKELELTRKELARSAQAQELSEKALRTQADEAKRSGRIAAINSLIEHYRSEVKDIDKDILASLSGPKKNRRELLDERQKELVDKLDELYEYLVGE